MPFTKILKSTLRTRKGFVYSDLMVGPKAVDRMTIPDIAFPRLR